MNPASQISINPGMIFVIVALLIVLAMMMGGKNRTTHRTSYGWWIGLGVLLLIGSGFIFFTRSGSGPITEVRHSVKSALIEMKNQLRSGTETVRDSLEQGLDEMSKSVDQVQEAVGSLSSSDSKAKGKRKPPAVVNTTLPSGNVSWTVEVKEKERKQKKEDVDMLLLSKATSSINRWVTDRMPMKNIYLNAVITPWLQERGVFSEPIDYQSEDVPRANTSETDQLFGGTMKVVLTPAIQQNLIDLGYERLNAVLKNDQFQAQWIITIILLGITGFVAILGLVKTLVTRRVNGNAADPVS